MLKKTLAVALLGTCIAPATFATSLFKQFVSTHKITKSINNQAAHFNKINSQYTNFSGTWTGSCTGTTDGEEDTLIIENNASFISFGENLLPIGSLINRSESFKNEASDNHTLLNWSNNGHTLTMDSIWVAVATPQQSNAFCAHTSSMTSSITLVNGQLIITGTTSGGDGEDPAAFECKF